VSRYSFALAILCVTACSRSSAPPAESKAPSVRITQFYASPAEIGRGEKTLLCYGVENAKSVSLTPPKRELSTALSRCVDVQPSETTTYTLVAEGDGEPARQDVTVTIGAAKPPGVKIVEVRVTALEITRGQPVSICYKVANAKSVRIEPTTTPSEKSPNCGIVRPDRTTAYTVTATGAAGDQDQERVTIKVR
jgi:hypothetical protein